MAFRRAAGAVRSYRFDVPHGEMIVIDRATGFGLLRPVSVSCNPLHKKAVYGRNRSDVPLVGVLIATGLFGMSLIGPDAQAAPNALCAITGSAADCSDVTSEGVSYSNSVVSTVNAGNSVAGATSVNSSVIGIFLSRSGTNSPDSSSSISFTTVKVDHDGDGASSSPTPEVDVVANGSGTPILSGGQYIFANTTTEVYTIGATNYTGDQLLAFLQATGASPGGSISGSLTINNPGANPGDGSSLTTNNAHGLYVKSKGGKGGNGGCTTILLATWCDNGDSGGAAGSVAVNSNTTIVVNGTAARYGVYAESEGGLGGNGGGSFGLFASDAGNGGNGGNGNNVTVNLDSQSSITTRGSGGHGVFANSTGGNGGSGGSPSGLVALGDGGGNGGHAGVVTVINGGSILTYGAKAYGIYARSIGAGAGKGSSAGGLVALGGNGGGQTDGDDVTVTNSGRIETRNTDAFGIFAQSVGGGGGDGGGAGGLISVGGKGGSGGNSGEVEVNNSGVILTNSKGSTALVAQSIGGGGGNGGDAVAVGVGVSVGIGGTGGEGGDGDLVDVNLLAGSDIDTRGDEAHGVMAQSVGGGGGNGGFAVSVSVSPGPAVSVGVGGSGGKGGDAGLVTVDAAGSTDIYTTGEQSYGVMAQSIGGGGGNGGFAVSVAAASGPSLSVGVGGTGGDGGDAGSVIVTTQAGSNIETTKDRSHGLLAQSIGGGGGNGGFAVSASVSTGAPAASVGIGGDGSGGGLGKYVEVNNAGSIATGGNDAFGLVAQSIGGGGGNGGVTVSAAVASVGVGIGLSGGGGSGASSDSVKVDNDGAITTDGDRSRGIFAQSIGGGGGSGGLNVTGAIGAGAISVGLGGDGGAGGSVVAGKTVTVDNSGTIITKKTDSHGIHAQSVGGGGGAGGATISAALSAGPVAGSVAVGVGGDGGGGGHGRVVNVTNTGTIETRADRSYGIAAQSIGGGGGDGGLSVAAAASFSKKFSVAVGVSVGGTGGDAGTGSTVNVDNQKSISTGGGLSHGILAQSIGGGGGSGGASIAGAVAVSGGPSGAVGISVGGGGGTGGYSGRVDVDNTGQITTQSANASGIRAQSIGGGGGNGGFAGAGTISVSGKKSAGASVSIGGAGGGANYAGIVDINNTAAISTTGNYATGIYGESIGGGGGSGGGSFNLTAGFSTSGGSMAASVGIGGNGGIGSNGDLVQIVHDGNVTTGSSANSTGFMAHGIHATSIGGGGGSGGWVASIAATGSSKSGGSVAVSVGGQGGNGGVGKNVGVGVTLDQSAGASRGTKTGTDSITGTITTNGDEASGIYAESVGGGGGNGGFAGAFTGSFNNSDKKTLALSVAVGGAGGDGGFAGNVYVDSAATLNINGDRSNGILARSVGGGGGNGGGSATGAFGSKDATTINVAVGGAGGDGTIGGDVEVMNSGNITLTSSAVAAESQDANAAILAQSIGGGGGNGGFAFSMSGSGPESRGINVSVGGNGGGIIKPSDGILSFSGDVTVNNTGSILTQGGKAYGILGQSIGGSGGNGGFAAAIGLSVLPADKKKWTVNASVAVGGVGGSGNEGGDVTITNDNFIVTQANDSHAVYAQSIGGGGGNGGTAFTGNIGLGDGDGKSFQAAVAVGGNGGDGDHGGIVRVNNNAALQTFGDMSTAIMAQSIGGGGGAGGGANALNILLNKGNFDPFAKFSASNWKMEVAVGGTGGSGQNDGGNVIIDNTADIVTVGDQSRGIWAQSIGGGGGNGGQGALSTGFAEGDLLVAVATCLPCNLPNIIDPTDWSFIVGGNAGAHGDGKLVTVDNSAFITTYGSFSHAIYAQSIGGGGGEATIWSKDSASAIGGNAAIGPNGKFGLGGEGGAAGSASKVTVNLYAGGGIETWGAEAHGVFAQSIGGGGGTAGSIDRTLPNPNFLQSITGVTDLPNVGLGFGYARAGGGGGDGGDVDVLSSQNIDVHGRTSIGIFAQSVGGGGGTAGGTGIGPNIQVFVGSVGGDGDGGVVNVTQAGYIDSHGAYGAHGILAQSAGGGNGAAVGFGKDVNVTLNGDIWARGQNAIGILAQSVGADGAGDVTINIGQDSEVIGGTHLGLDTSVQPEAASAIQFLDGKDNTLINRGMLITKDRLEGYAVRGTTGNDTIDNYNLVFGMVDLGTGTNAFNNMTNASFIMGQIVDLGGGLITNDGIMAPAGFDLTGTTNINGSWVQNAGGIYQVDWDFFGSVADQINLTGSANMAGTLDLNIFYRGFATPGVDEVTVVTTGTGYTDSGLILQVFDPAVADYELIYPNINDLVIKRTVDFSPSALNKNQTSLGDALNKIQGTGSFPGFDQIIEAVYNIRDDKDLAAAYDVLGPEIYLDNEIFLLLGANDFSKHLQSCRNKEGDHRFISQRNCNWARADVAFSERDATVEATKVREDSYELSGGQQWRDGKNLHRGVGFSYEVSRTQLNEFLHSNNQQIEVGGVVKKQAGPFLIAGTATAGHSWSRSERRIPLQQPEPVFASGFHQMTYAAGHASGSWLFGDQGLYIVPGVDVGATVIHSAEVHEEGKTKANLKIDDFTQGFLTVEPSLEIGGEFQHPFGSVIRPFIKLGMTHFYGNRDAELTAEYVGAAAGVAPFVEEVSIDDVQWNVTTAVDILTTSEGVIRLGYEGRVSEDLEEHGGFVKVALPF